MGRKHFKSEDLLYQQVADGLEKMIEDDVLKIGDKLPSVRVLSDEYGISMGTAFQAYYHLEGKGLIESRPKSGYYVRFNHKRFRELPNVVHPESNSHDVSVKEMISQIYNDVALINEKVINFAIAVPDTNLLPGAKIAKSVIHALRHREDYCLSYENTQGNTDLRKQISKLAFNWGGKIKPEEIVVTAGCLEAITICLRAVTKPGDTIAAESPNYFGVFQAIESLGLKVVEITSDPVTGLDINSLKETITRNQVRAIVTVPNFNNPMGSCMPDEEKKRLVNLVTKHQIPLIEDDIYGELYFGRHRPKTCKSFDKEGWVLHCSSISKSLAPGYRIGWALPGRFTEQVVRLKLVPQENPQVDFHSSRSWVKL